MKFRLVGGLVGLIAALAIGYGVNEVADLRWALAAGVGVGTGLFLVIDGSAGTGEGWIYHRVRTTAGRVVDGLVAVIGGVALGGFSAALSLLLELGIVGSSILVIAGALIGANAAFVYRRPNYEERLEDDE